MTNLSLKPEFILAVGESSVLVFDQRNENGFIPPKTISIKTAQERIFQALLQGYSVHSEEHETHTRIYIVSPKEMERGRIAFAKEYLKNA